MRFQVSQVLFECLGGPSDSFADVRRERATPRAHSSHAKVEVQEQKGGRKGE